MSPHNKQSNFLEQGVQSCFVACHRWSSICAKAHHVIPQGVFVLHVTQQTFLVLSEAQEEGDRTEGLWELHPPICMAQKPRNVHHTPQCSHHLEEPPLHCGVGEWCMAFSCLPYFPLTLSSPYWLGRGVNQGISNHVRVLGLCNASNSSQMMFGQRQTWLSWIAGSVLYPAASVKNPLHIPYIPVPSVFNHERHGMRTFILSRVGLANWKPRESLSKDLTIKLPSCLKDH